MARGFSHAPGASPEVSDALRPDMEPARIAQLAQSRNAVVREAIASRTDIPLGAMVGLAHDTSVPVRTMVAANPAIAQSVAEHLAHDRHREVLIALAANPRTPTHVAEQLAAHKRPEVRRAAGVRLDAQASAVPQPPVDVPDAVIPELRERATLAPDDEQYPAGQWQPSGFPTSPQQASEPPPAPAPALEIAESLPPDTDVPTPTRTAPVRGFRSPLGAP